MAYEERWFLSRTNRRMRLCEVTTHANKISARRMAVGYRDSLVCVDVASVPMRLRAHRLPIHKSHPRACGSVTCDGPCRGNSVRICRAKRRRTNHKLLANKMLRLAARNRGEQRFCRRDRSNRGLACPSERNTAIRGFTAARNASDQQLQPRILIRPCVVATNILRDDVVWQRRRDALDLPHRRDDRMPVRRLQRRQAGRREEQRG